MVLEEIDFFGLDQTVQNKIINLKFVHAVFLIIIKLDSYGIVFRNFLILFLFTLKAIYKCHFNGQKLF